jgi:dolichol-phosphate mannosyltransferase
MISVVIPIFNEENLIHELVQRTAESLQAITQRYEMVFVDDGSQDQSISYLLELKKSDPRIKVISLSRNFGHQAAITAGLEYVRGDFIAILDGDLQDPPELLKDMYRAIVEEHYDVAVGYRKDREDSRRWLTGLFHRIFGHVSGLDDIEHTGHFSMMTRKALRALLAMKEKTRYIPGLRSFIGFRQKQIAYVRQERSSGESKMKISHLFRLASDALFAFSRLPIRFCLYIGLTGIFIFFLAGIHVLVSKILGWAPLGWSSTLISIYFLGSIQLTFLGILGEYLFRIYKESQNRPLYFIKQIFD